VTWVKLDDQATVHPKMVKAGFEAAWLWTCGLSYCNRFTTDGRIEKSLLTMLYPSGEWTAKRLQKLAAKLVTVGLWVDKGDHFQVHQYSDHQLAATKVEVESRRSLTAARVKKHRATTKVSPTSENVSDAFSEQVPDKPIETSECNAVTPALVTPLQNQTRTRPDSKKEESVGARDHSPSAAPQAAPEEDFSVRISELSSRYPKQLLAAVYDGCRLHRQSARIADSVWLATLEKLAAHPVDVVERAMTTFVDRYGAGARDERYLLGIVRGEASSATSQPARGRLAVAPPCRDEDFEGTPEDDLPSPERLKEMRAYLNRTPLEKLEAMR
jgi:hypothetical protein